MSVEDITGALGRAEEVVGEAIGSLQHASTSLEGAQGDLYRATEGSGQSDVSEAIGLLGEAVSRIGEVKDMASQAKSAIRSAIGRLSVGDAAAGTGAATGATAGAPVARPPDRPSPPDTHDRNVFYDQQKGFTVIDNEIPQVPSDHVVEYARDFASPTTLFSRWHNGDAFPAYGRKFLQAYHRRYGKEETRRLIAQVEVESDYAGQDAFSMPEDYTD